MLARNGWYKINENCQKQNIFESPYLVVAGLTGPLLELVGEGGVAEAVVDQLDIAHFVVYVLPNHIRLPELKQVL